MERDRAKLLLFGIVIFTISSFNLYSQSTKVDGFLNKYNTDGEKTGLWITENDAGYRNAAYYKNGKNHGISVYYDLRSGYLSLFAEFTEGAPSGHWFYFGYYGQLIGERFDFKRNDITLHLSSGDICPTTYCYSVSYYDTGVIESEGVELFFDLGEFDDFWKYGLQKYYFEDGTLKEQRYYSADGTVTYYDSCGQVIKTYNQ